LVHFIHGLFLRESQVERLGKFEYG